MWYGELSTLKVGEPIVSTVNKAELVNDKIYTIKEVFEYPSRNYITNWLVMMIFIIMSFSQNLHQLNCANLN